MATNINSKKVIVSRQAAQLYMAFVDMRNFIQFLPEDKKKDVSADYDTITASVQGFNIGLRVIERVPYSFIKFADNDAPFAFNLSIHFDSVVDNPDKTELYMHLSAELNFMMKTLIGSKLQSGLDKFVEAIAAMAEGRMPEGIDPSMYPEGFKTK